MTKKNTTRQMMFKAITAAIMPTKIRNSVPIIEPRYLKPLALSTIEREHI